MDTFPSREATWRSGTATTDGWTPPQSGEGESEWPSIFRPTRPAPGARAGGFLTRIAARVGRGARWVRRAVRSPTIGLTFDGSRVRAVVVEGGKITAWGEAPAASAAGADGQDGDREDALAREVRDLLSLVPRGRLVVALPLHASLLRRFRLPRVSRRYLRQVAAAEVLGSVPFSEGEVDLAWLVSGKRHDLELVGTVVPKQAMDRNVRVCRLAGKAPSAVFPRAVALAAAVGLSDVIVVELDEASAVVVQVRNGAPTAVHRVPLPENGSAPETLAGVLASAVEQVASYRRAGADDGFWPDPVALTGPRAYHTALVEALADRLARPVVPVASPFTCPDHFPAHQYIANLGLVVADRRKTRAGGRLRRGRGPWTNALPSRHVPRPLPFVQVAVLVALLLAGYTAFGATSQVARTERGRDALAVQIESLERDARVHTLALGRAAVLSGRMDGLDQRRALLDAHVLRAGEDMARLVERLHAATGSLVSPGVRLSSLLLGDGSLVLAGAGASEKDVLDYAGALRRSGRFTGVRLLQLTMSPGSAAGPAATFLVEAGASDGGRLAQPSPSPSPRR